MDRRVARGELSKAALKTTFLELFQRKEPEDITVKELCEKAGVNRSTFYAHFGYMDALILEVLQESVAEVCLGFHLPWDLPMENEETTRRRIDTYLRRFLSNRTLQRFCTCANSGRFRSLILRAQVQHQIRSTTNSVPFYTAYYYNAGVFHCVLEWMNNGMVIPIDEVTQIILAFSKVRYQARK